MRDAAATTSTADDGIATAYAPPRTPGIAVASLVPAARLRRAEDRRVDIAAYAPGEPIALPLGEDGPGRRRLNPRAVSWALRLADALILIAAGAAGYAFVCGFAAAPDLAAGLAALAIITVAAQTRQAGRELLRDLIDRSPARLAVEAGLRCAIPFAAALGAVAILAPAAPLAAWLGVWAAGTLAATLTARAVARVLVGRWHRDGRLKRAVAIFGTGDLAARLLERLYARCADAVELVGVFDDRARIVNPHLRALLRGNTGDLIELSRRRMIDRVIVALPHAAEARLVEVLHKLHHMPVEISLAPDMVGFSVAGKDAAEFGGLPLIDVYGKPLSFGQNLAKGAFDKIVAALALVVAAPVLAATAIAVKLDSKGPVLFCQNRLGFGDRVIRVYKFRTMYAEASDFNCDRQASRDDPRITRIGGFLRKSSLDELPQLLNVLRGEMSLVGPRPHAVAMKVEHKRNEDIVPDYALRHHVKPGITGWAQVNGHNGPVDTEEALRARVAHDLDYINNWSLWFDIRSLLLTIKVFFSQRHAY